MMKRWKRKRLSEDQETRLLKLIDTINSKSSLRQCRALADFAKDWMENRRDSKVYRQYYFGNLSTLLPHENFVTLLEFYDLCIIYKITVLKKIVSAIIIKRMNPENAIRLWLASRNKHCRKNVANQVYAFIIENLYRTPTKTLVYLNLEDFLRLMGNVNHTNRMTLNEDMKYWFSTSQHTLSKSQVDDIISNLSNVNKYTDELQCVAMCDNDIHPTRMMVFMWTGISIKDCIIEFPYEIQKRFAKYGKKRHIFSRGYSMFVAFWKAETGEVKIEVLRYSFVGRQWHYVTKHITKTNSIEPRRIIIMDDNMLLLERPGIKLTMHSNPLIFECRLYYSFVSGKWKRYASVKKFVSYSFNKFVDDPAYRNKRLILQESFTTMDNYIVDVLPMNEYLESRQVGILPYRRTLLCTAYNPSHRDGDFQTVYDFQIYELEMKLFHAYGNDLIPDEDLEEGQPRDGPGIFVSTAVTKSPYPIFGFVAHNCKVVGFYYDKKNIRVYTGYMGDSEKYGYLYMSKYIYEQEYKNQIPVNTTPYFFGISNPESLFDISGDAEDIIDEIAK